MPRILVVDDEKSIRITLREFLRDAHYDVDVAANADEAMQLLAAREFDVVVSDIILPRVTGVSLLKAIKKASPQVQVVLITGEPTIETSSEAVRMGAFDYLSKPVGKNHLLRVVANAVLVKALHDERQRLQHENERYQHDLEKLVEERTAALRASERQYRLLADNATDIIWTADLNLALTYVSPAVERIRGYTPQEAITLSASQRFTPNSTKVAKELLASTIRRVSEGTLTADARVTAELEMTCKDGSTVWVEVTTRLLFDSDAKLTGLMGISRDITERRRADAERTRLMMAVEQATESIVITDTQGLVQYANEAFENTTGFTQHEIIGQHIRVMRSGKHDDAFYSKMWAKLSEGQTWSGEFINKRKNGTLYVEQATISPVRDATGEISNYVAVKRDITKEKRAAEALRESEERFSQISEHIDEVFWLCDVQDPSNHQCLYVNSVFERIWQRSADELYSDSAVWFEPIHDDDRAGVVAAFRDFIIGKGAFDVQFRVVRADDSQRIVHATGRLVRDKAGTILRAAGNVRDVTEHLRLEAEHDRLEGQYLHAQKMEAIGRLAGGVAHDFNNLLTVIISYATLARSDLRPQDPLRSDVEQILRAGERASTLTRQLLAFSRKQVMASRSLNLNDVVSEMEKMLRRLIGEDIALRTTLADNLGKVIGDPGQLEQVVMNLAINARDAMPTGGTLLIETSNVKSHQFSSDGADVASETYVMLKVSDDGIGMDAKTKAQVFEPFFTTKEVGSGTGLGLSTVYGIVKQSGGLLSVSSELGRGTSFTVYLPATDAAVSGLIEKVHIAQLHGSETVLVVEDEDAVRMVATRVLSGAGYRVIAAANAGEALLHCERHDGDIHILLTDVVMPQMNGKELAERLADVRPQMRVLFMSGYVGGAVTRHSILDEDSHFIAKPFTPPDLLEKIRGALNA